MNFFSLFVNSKGVCARPPKWESKDPPDAASGSNNNPNKTEDTLSPADALTENMEAAQQNEMENNYTSSSRLSSSIKNHEDDLRPGIKNGRTSPSNVLRRRLLPKQQHVRRLSLQDFVLEEQSIESIPEVKCGDCSMQVIMFIPPYYSKSWHVTKQKYGYQ